MKLRVVPVVLILAICIGSGIYLRHSLPWGDVLTQKLTGKATVASRLAEYGESSRAHWGSAFQVAQISYPPRHLALVAFKAEKRLEIYARDDARARWKFVAAKPILQASGKMGPKLREGDLQVPEGFYHVESLNPNSAFHLSLRVSYPSDEDRQIAAREGRENLGGDIMIHGGNASAGCLAMGDDGAEDLFVLAAESGIENIQIVMCPLDFREQDLPSDPQRPEWLTARYRKLRDFVLKLPKH